MIKARKTIKEYPQRIIDLTIEGIIAIKPFTSYKEGSEKFGCRSHHASGFLDFSLPGKEEINPKKKGDRFWKRARRASQQRRHTNWERNTKEPTGDAVSARWLPSRMSWG
jgi:hypothetical protein